MEEFAMLELTLIQNCGIQKVLDVLHSQTSRATLLLLVQDLCNSSMEKLTNVYVTKLVSLILICITHLSCNTLLA